MDNRILTRLLAASALVLVALALVVPTAGADPGGGAFVVNKPGGNTCEFTDGDNVYDGGGVLVVTPNGRLMLTCNARLVEGPGVTSTTHTVFPETFDDIPIVCRAVETPSGNANVTCRGLVS